MPHLPDELVEEVFLRLPPDEPAALVRASLASKTWLGLLTGPAFRGRYREFHSAPPMLGFLYNCPDASRREEDPPLGFLSTAKFGMRVPHFTPDRRYHAWDCRHGRVLLGDMDYYPDALVVWDPMTGSIRELNEPNHYIATDNFEIAVLCAVSGCDHRSCHVGPFKMVCVGVDKSEGECVALAFVSSPDMGDWSKPSELHGEEWMGPCPGVDIAADALLQPMPAVLVHDALHFMLWYRDDNDRVGILKYSLSSDSLSLIDVPFATRAHMLMAMKDGCLGLAHVDRRLTLYVWSKPIDSNGVASWTRRRVVELKTLLPIKNLKRRPRLIGSVEGCDIIFVNTDLGVYQIDLNTLEWKELWKRENLGALIPYMSFRT